MGGFANIGVLSGLLGTDLKGYEVPAGQNKDNGVVFINGPATYLDGTPMDHDKLLKNPLSQWVCRSYYTLFADGKVTGTKYCTVLELIDDKFMSYSTFESLPVPKSIDAAQVKIIMAALGENISETFIEENSEAIEALKANLISE